MRTGQRDRAVYRRALPSDRRRPHTNSQILPCRLHVIVDFGACRLTAHGRSTLGRPSHLLFTRSFQETR
eukprot:755102-Hanusia_phi.AAC.4